jgi:hypothetical protein
MPDKFELVDADFGEDVNAEIEQYVENQIEYLEVSHKDLHENKIPAWRKNYMGIPAEKSKSFPWPNAANTVVQIIGETVDTLAARVLGLLFATHPLWAYQSFFKAQDPEGSERAEEQRRTLEDFMDLVGYEPTELDLYRVEGQWFTDCAKLGTSFVKPYIEDRIEAVVIGYDETGKKRKGEDTTLYSGPRVEKLRHEDVLAYPDAQTIGKSPFVAHRRSLKKMDLESRAFEGVYDEEAVSKIIAGPDRSTPRTTEREELQSEGITTPALPDATAEWDIYECYFYWWAGAKKNRHKYRLIYSYHKKSRTVLRRVFNFLPDNETPIIRAKLGYRTDGMYGHGYSELLSIYQEELSSTHNQRLDNATVANTRALRVSPRARSLDSNFELYPSALLVGEEGDVESIQIGDVYPSTFKNEEMTLSLVARRAGISPAVSGSGAGGVMRRPAVYSSMGTLAVMQEANSRTGHATSEFRHAHVMLGSLLTSMYGKFGTFGKESVFGLDAGNLRRALEEFNAHRLRIPIRAATGSLNSEVSKQNDMLLVGLMQRHYTAISQLMQAMANPQVTDEAKDYFKKVISASERLHKTILKDFGYDQPERFVPEARTKAQQPTNGQAALSDQARQMAAARLSLAEPLRTAVPGGQNLPESGVESTGAGPPPPQGPGA